MSQFLVHFPFHAPRGIGLQIGLQTRLGIHHHAAQLEHPKDASMPPDTLLHEERRLAVAHDQKAQHTHRHQHRRRRK